MAPLQLLVVPLLTLLFTGEVRPQPQKIPRELLECYLDANNRDHEAITLPMNLEIFLDIIHKMESSPHFSMDMSTFVATLLKRFWRDGIEVDRSIIMVDRDVIPYITAGRDTYKYEFLTKYMVPTVRENNDFNEITTNLTRSERCTLHRMLSRSIDIWERGDEFYVCQNYLDSKVTNAGGDGFRKSSCPIERGVIWTGSGTVSLSNILVALATSLKPMNVPLAYVLHTGDYTNQTIHNSWSSLTAELSELLITQIPLKGQHFELGPPGRWNDTDLPVEHYMALTEDVLRNKFWQFTDAEILGSIDGLMMAEEAVSWLRSGKPLRLSQLFEAFYSKKYNENSIRAHACFRKPFFDNAVATNKILPEQVESYALALIPNMPNYIKNDSIVHIETKALLNDFNAYTLNMIWRAEKCPNGVHYKPKVKINLITDPSWTPYETMKFLMMFGANIEVSPGGSIMSVIKGGNGKIIAKEDNSLGSILLRWRRVNTLGVPSLREGLMSVRDLVLEPPSQGGGGEMEGVPYTHITLVLSTSTVISDGDISAAQSLLKSIKSQNPDMRFIYVTATHLAPMYVKLTSIPGSINDEIVTVDVSERKLLDQLGVINKYPKAIQPKTCNNSTQNSDLGFMDFANPGTILFYRIHPCYLTQSSQINIVISNRNKGNVIACMAREESELEKDCKEASLTEKISFTIKEPCPGKTVYGKNMSEWNGQCKPIYLKITGKRSFGSCTEKICRMPDDIPFDLTVNGMKCVLDHPICNSSDLQKSSIILISLASIFTFLMYFNNI